MRGGSGIDVTISDGGPARPLRVLVSLLLALALLAGSGVGRQVAWAQGSGGDAGADATAVDDEEDADEEDRGIDLPFTSRDDDESGDGVDEDGPAFTLTAYVCTPGDDTALRDRMLVESSTDPDAFFEDGIEQDELREVCAAPAEAQTYTLTDVETDEIDVRELGGEEEPSTTWANLSSAGTEYTLGVDGQATYGDPIVFCTVASDPPGTRTQYYATDGAIRFSIAEGRDHTCEWFNVDLGDVPADEAGVTGGEDAATPAAGGATARTAAISVRSYDCVPGDDSELLDRINYQIENWTTVDPVQGISLDELHDTCEPSAEEITFTVTDQDTNEIEEKALGGEENDDYVTWDIEANVGYAVDADEPDGYGEPIVFCAFHDSGDTAEDLSPSPMTDGVLYVGMGAGTTYTCDWFHVDLGDPAARGGGEIASAVLDRGGEMEPGPNA